MYRIVSANFVLSGYSYHQVEQFELPEVAFVGRSNVGKSTLLNSICKQKDLARVSKTPGRTQALNYFQVEAVEEHKDAGSGEISRIAKHQMHFVDLPGYGHAAVPKKVRAAWEELLAQYLTERAELKLVVMLLDSRREIQAEENWFWEIVGAARLLPVLTKTDKLNQSELSATRKRTKDFFGDGVERILESGVFGGKSRGIKEISDEICLRVLAD